MQLTISRNSSLDAIFSSLADETRRDILNRVSKKQLSVGEIAKHYKLTFAAISKHLKVLEKASLIIKQRRGKEQIIRISPDALAMANKYLETYEQHWENRLNNLDKLLTGKKS
ncbi:MAG: winged helix-turn-helix transcriptional regulator [Candidatus Doudnabacteria bacterium]|nr:winged helix-turn-helix transcriptional regulator [Candidatus Doudnabacteria bacterium]